MPGDLLLPWRSEADDDAVDAAADVAAALDARLSIAVVVELPPPLHKDGLLVQVHRWTGLYDALRDDADVHVARLRDRLAGRAIASDVRRLDALYHTGPDVAAVHARHVDLVMLGAAGDAHEHWMHVLLTASGRPVLRLPGTGVALPARRVVVGWKSTREAARAVHDMRTLLAADAEVDVVAVDADARDDGAALVALLARRGLHARVVHLPGNDEPAAAVLLRHAARIDADLLVCGGYGHSRLRERLFGGVTLDLLACSPLPVLFSH